MESKKVIGFLILVSNGQAGSNGSWNVIGSSQIF
mgnify:CR=1 FL=1